jgi:hypothetical protein
MSSVAARLIKRPWWVPALDLGLRSAGSRVRLAGYLFASIVLGLAWYSLVLNVDPLRGFLGEMFSYNVIHSAGTCACMVATSCVMSILFHRAIVNARPTQVAFVGVIAMVLGAGGFVFLRAIVAALVGEEARAGAPNLIGLLVLTLVGMLAALEACWFTIPGAMLSVLVLRLIGRAPPGVQTQSLATASRG